MLHLDKYDEDYLITLLAFHIKGLLTGNPHLELEGATRIDSSTGFIFRIEYSGVGLFSAKRSSFVARLYHNSREDEPICSTTRKLTDTFAVQNESSQAIEICHANAHENNSLIVANIDHENGWESRKAWSKVTTAIKAGNIITTVREKSKIEQA